ncbi:hypothetical protein V9T40_006208 [Parthenolecanium corni]|uniref:Uncharacterized protein n=1 Tax=Parthenolecanium corni TaxID=536013 RepID=A0AAN9TWD5_9HEMI
MNPLSEHNNIVAEYLRTERELKRKFEEIKFGRLQKNIQRAEMFKPLLTPLQEINTKIATLSNVETAKHEEEIATLKRKFEIQSGIGDDQYGLHNVNGKLVVGCKQVELSGDYVIFKDSGKKYRLTEGLWDLLTKAKPGDEFDSTDLQHYSEIVRDTYTYKLRNDPMTNRVKSNRGKKYKEIIQPIMYKYNLNKSKQERFEGEGLNKLVTSKNHNIEYIYWNNIDELLERIQRNMSRNYIERRDHEYTEKFLPKPLVDGKGLINSLIDNLPIPLHLPGFNYAGSGTPLDLNFERGVKPINKLDKAAMKHDIAYLKSEALKKHHDANFVLQGEAWKRVNADDSSLGEKANAWFVTTTMKAKQAIGAGVSEPQYTEYPVNLDKGDLEKLKSAAKSKKGVNILLKFNRTKESIANNISIPLTAKQIQNVKALHSKRLDAKVRLTAAQLKVISTAEGGFLPTLLAAAPTIAAVGSLITQGVNAYNNKKANDKLVEERMRHNKVIEAANSGKSAEGEGIYILKKPVSRNGTSRKKKDVSGNGLYEELFKKKKVPLTNFDIVKMVKSIKMPYFGGVYMRDGLPAKPMINERAVVNLDSSEGRGTHWVCYSKKGNKVEYFDSFGVQPPIELINYFGKKAIISYNSEQIQKIDQIICGHLCLEWLSGLDSRKERMK